MATPLGPALDPTVAMLRETNAMQPGLAAVFDRIVVGLRDDMTRNGVDLTDTAQNHAVLMACSLLASLFADPLSQFFPPELIIGALAIATEESAPC